MTANDVLRKSPKELTHLWVQSESVFRLFQSYDDEQHPTADAICIIFGKVFSMGLLSGAASLRQFTCDK